MIKLQNFNACINDKHILRDINLEFEENKITAIIGPSGAGKSTLIRSINRINDEVENFEFSGTILFNGKNIHKTKTPIHKLRKQIGMLFQKPCVFPKSIRKNIEFGIKHDTSKENFDKIVEQNLKAVSLWDEVHNRLDDQATTLSIGQQQRLCLARALAVKPKVILMDEPTSALDPQATLNIEQLIKNLKKEYTIIIVTHNIEQAKRISDKVVFMKDGQVIEEGTQNIFKNPKSNKTKEYLAYHHGMD